MPSIAEWCAKVHECALTHGWWDKEREFPEIVALLHSEVSEAFEECRLGWAVQRVYYHPVKGDKPLGVPIELADIVIRVMDFCAHAGIDLEAAITAKHRYNLTRSYRHGGKLA